jgi:UDP-N-acetylglucosamine diphosphorylase / glucose-1-phosphate thymidylyltransferase / UDP-N-acetylgalactosamine diphosphorylase / glucosamine-1-phosphate N-acetyltransferase / galactosamine-1-phosphate N-acetyltransferase
MLNRFDPRKFFDIEKSSFHKLFDLNESVWVALQKLKKYIDSESLGNICIDIPTSVFLANPSLISIGEGTKIHPGAYIEGPCIIGKNVEIGHGAFIRPYNLIDNFCKIGHATEVKGSIFFPHAKAPHFNYVGDSILGCEVNLGAGVVCANYKINKTEVMIDNEGQKIATGMEKLGAIIGDGTSLGCNSVTNPGTLLKKNFWCVPCSNIKGVIL